MGWNISLFHYRNHGAGACRARLRCFAALPYSLFATILDVGKILAGIQVPPEDTEQFSEYLQKLGYPYVEETENEVYKRYLRG